MISWELARRKMVFFYSLGQYAYPSRRDMQKLQHASFPQRNTTIEIKLIMDLMKSQKISISLKKMKRLKQILAAHCNRLV